MVKLFKRRWYLVAEHNDKVKLFAIDRIQSVSPTEQRFRIPEDFDPKKYFSTAFGIEVDRAIKVEIVELKVYGRQVDYFREFPLHQSQEEGATTQDHTIFSYNLSPTNDLMRELLSKGAEVEVLKPQWFRAKIAHETKLMQKRYR